MLSKHIVACGAIEARRLLLSAPEIDLSSRQSGPGLSMTHSGVTHLTGNNVQDNVRPNKW